MSQQQFQLKILFFFFCNCNFRFNYRAYAGLGHAARCAGDYGQSKIWHNKQLEQALVARDKIGEGNQFN